MKWESEMGVWELPCAVEAVTLPAISMCQPQFPTQYLLVVLQSVECRLPKEPVMREACPLVAKHIQTSESSERPVQQTSLTGIRPSPPSSPPTPMPNSHLHLHTYPHSSLSPPLTYVLFRAFFFTMIFFF